MAARRRSSQRWLQEHFSDPYVKRSHAEGVRSRAAYKLQELLSRDSLLRPGMVVVDLGAAPGGWSQQVRQLLGSQGRVIALDLLQMAPLAGVELIRGDFQDPLVQQRLETLLRAQPVDLVLSDMAPNMSGVDAVDQSRMMSLADSARDFADAQLRSGGDFVIKLFHGAGFDAFIRDLRSRYGKVVIRKPAASRKRSREVYALAQSKRV